MRETAFSREDSCPIRREPRQVIESTCDLLEKNLEIEISVITMYKVHLDDIYIRIEHSLRPRLSERTF